MATTTRTAANSRTRKCDTGEQGNGGEFAAVTRADADVPIPAAPTAARPVLGEDTQVAASAHLGDNVSIGDSAQIGEDVTIRTHVTIGASVVIRDGATIAAGTSIGVDATIGERVNVGRTRSFARA